MNDETVLCERQSAVGRMTMKLSEEKAISDRSIHHQFSLVLTKVLPIPTPQSPPRFRNLFPDELMTEAI